jgi:hypothetical protein
MWFSKIQVFWDVALLCVSNFEHIKGLGCLILHGQAVQKSDPEDEGTKVLRNSMNYIRSATT